MKKKVIIIRKKAPPPTKKLIKKIKKKELTKPELLALKGERFVNFVFPIKKWNKAAEIAIKSGKTPNEMVWNILEKTLDL